MSQTMLHFVGGMQRHLPDLLLTQAPNVNSLKRFVPGFDALIAANWGFNNRTTALRVLVGKANSRRVENRICGADVNPYLAMAATLGAGLMGIEDGTVPTAETDYNAFQSQSRISSDQCFPATIHHAIERFRHSAVAAELFGKEFVRVYADSREAHANDYDKHVSGWEIQQFLETA